MQANDRTAIIGAGMGGLAAAVALAAEGRAVTVFERQPEPGGKARNVMVDGHPVAAGPTVLTMKWAFDRLFAKAGKRLDDAVKLNQADILARHAWLDGSRLDLFADIGQSADAIGMFSNCANADGYRRFCADSASIFATLRDTYIDAQRPGPFELMSRIGLMDPWRQLALKPLSTMWSALSAYFTDPRLQQLFGRYATYCGSSPFAAPATLMLVAHVEQAGVWIPEGGLHGVARALRHLAESLGATFHFECAVEVIETEGGTVSGLRLADGERIDARHIIFNGDVSALAPMLPDNARSGADPVQPAHRSLSAMTWCVQAKASGFPLAHHTVFFSDDYRREFEAILRERRFPDTPTTYICAQDRNAAGDLATPGADGRERMLFIINAAADGDRRTYSEGETRQCLDIILTHLERCGLTMDRGTLAAVPATPADFNRLYPRTGGALYGRASHGWMASFQRPGARTRIPGLYLAGGSVHPGPGVPMAALSGMLAAESLASDRASTPKFRRAGISGGTSTG